jgi:GT2 family glycosyltransferase
MNKVTVIVVAYNRAELLKETLSALQNQSVKLHKVIVINNASTDNTKIIATNHSVKPFVYNSEKNTGGAGGFYIGLKIAYEKFNSDFYYLMDDDCIPKKDAVEELLKANDNYYKNTSIHLSVLSSKAIWTNGKQHPMNKSRIKPFVSNIELKNAKKINAVPIRSASFVAFFVSNNAVKSYGYPLKNYFIWNDDFEYSTRILKKNIGIFVPQSVVVHKTNYFGDTATDPGNKFYYEVRNKIWIFFKSKNFYLNEWLLYFFSTIRRWFITWLKSKNKKIICKSFKKGLKDGIFKNPTTFNNNIL